MPTSCCAYNCNERFTLGSKVSFHRFPRKDKMLFRAWCIAVRRKDFRPTLASRVCSKHFTPDSFLSSNNYSYLKINAVPTIFDFSSKKDGIYKSQKPLKRKKSNQRTPPRRKTSDFQDDEHTDTSSEIDEKPNVVEIIKLRRENTDKESGMESNQEQFAASYETTEEGVTVGKLVKIDSLPSDQFYNMQNENEILRQTIDHLNKKIERFKCMTNVLHSNELISEEAAEVLQCTINM